jgi:hypothetical protein
VPLQVAIRGIDIAMDSFFSRQRSGGSKINSLCYCHDSVMEEFARHQESRIGEARTTHREQAGSRENEAPADSGTDEEITQAAEYMAAIIDEIKTLSAKQPLSEFALEGIGRVEERLAAMLQSLRTGAQADLEALERDLCIADEILVEALCSDVSAEQTTVWEKEAKAELKIYRKKLPKALYTKIHDNFIRGKIHQKFNIQEFSLFQL